MKKNLNIATTACVILTFPMLALAQNVAGAVAAMAMPVASTVAGSAPEASRDDGGALAAAAGPVAKVEIATRRTRSSVAMSNSDMQKILPGINPL